MPDTLTKAEGLRERNRRETRQRIADVGIELFLAHGYDAATLDKIAAAAGISRRTFFYYFESKDDILLAHFEGFGDALKTAVLENSSAGSPVDVVCEALLKASGRFQLDQIVKIAKMAKESETLRLSRQRRYLEYEQAVYAALCELWPARGRRDRLRLVSIASIGALRFAVDRWLEDGCKRAAVKYIQAAFSNLKAEIGGTGRS